MKGGTLFSGGGGFCLGMVAAGVDHAWGIEYDDKIAQVARDNGLATITADILQCDPADFEPVDFLHASPPCPNFSNAKTDAEETENDRALAAKVCQFVTELLPRIFTLENVYQYRNSQSWETIARTLLTHGYQVNYWHVNMADYGVPQTRQRMIAIARRDGKTPMLPPATHDEKPVNGFFERRERWVSWYEAIEDLIPMLPDSEFAPWQLERLPDEYKTLYVDGQLNGGELYTRESTDPMLTIKASISGNGRMPRAFICAQGKYDNGVPTYDQGQPHGTVTANSNQTGIRAFILDGQNAGRDLTVLDSDDSFCTLGASGKATYRAFIVGDQNSHDGSRVMSRTEEHPAFVADTRDAGKVRAMANGRIVKMSPRALARFQAFPDDYELPDNNALACRIIGNAVPPLFAQRLVEWLK